MTALAYVGMASLGVAVVACLAWSICYPKFSRHIHNTDPATWDAIGRPHHPWLGYKPTIRLAMYLLSGKYSELHDSKAIEAAQRARVALIIELGAALTAVTIYGLMSQGRS
jgi:hypothetical protein